MQTIHAGFDGKVFVSCEPGNSPVETRVEASMPWPPGNGTPELKAEWDELMKILESTQPYFPTVEDALRYGRKYPPEWHLGEVMSAQETKSAVRVDEHGVYRVADTRVMLESVIYPFLRGESLESIREGYPALTILEISAAIGFFKANRAEVELYLENQEMLWRRLRADQDSNPSPPVKRLREFKERCERRCIPVWGQ